MNNTLLIIWLVFNGLLLFTWLGICCIFTSPYIKKYGSTPTRFGLQIFVEAVTDYFVARRIAKERNENPLALRIHGYLTYYVLIGGGAGIVIGIVVGVYRSLS